MDLGEPFINFIQGLIDVQRLCPIPDKTPRSRRISVFCSGRCGHHHGWHMFQTIVSTQGREQVKAIHVRKVHVEQEQIWRPGHRISDGAGPVSCHIQHNLGAQANDRRLSNHLSQKT
nr:hypothetical protein [Aquabacterium sp.]